jgi:hypothetical protein
VSKTCGPVITDVTAPVIIVPYDITAEATSAAGASVSYSVTSQDAVEDLCPHRWPCVPPSSSIFPLDATTIVACTDRREPTNVANASFKITVQDTTPPILAVPGDHRVEATRPQAPSATSGHEADLVDGSLRPAASLRRPLRARRTTVTWHARANNIRRVTSRARQTAGHRRRHSCRSDQPPCHVHVQHRAERRRHGLTHGLASGHFGSADA